MWELALMYLAQAIALPVVKGCVIAWTQLYTMAAPENERESRRAEILSDLHEQISVSRSEGVGPAGIAVCVLLRMFWGLKDDVVWFTPYLPALIAQKLDAGGAMLTRIRVPDLVVTSLAVLILTNVDYLLPFGNASREAWVSNNAPTLGYLSLMWVASISPLRRWVEPITKVSVFWVIVALLVVVTVSDLRDSPLFHKILFATIPVALALTVNEELFRTRFFKGRQWPVVMSWGIILAASLSISWITSSVMVVLAVWGVIGLAALILMLVCLLAVTLAAGVLYGSMSATAGGMRLVATGLRRLL